MFGDIGGSSDLSKIGLPFHGQVFKDYVSVQDGYGQYYFVDTEEQFDGSNYIVKNPAGENIPNEHTWENELGWEWRDYAIISSRKRCYGNQPLDYGRHIYVDSNNVPWLIDTQVTNPSGDHSLQIKVVLVSRFGFIDEGDPDPALLNTELSSVSYSGTAFDNVFPPKYFNSETPPTPPSGYTTDRAVINSTFVNYDGSEFNETGSEVLLNVTGTHLNTLHLDTPRFMYGGTGDTQYLEYLHLFALFKITISGAGNTDSQIGPIGQGIAANISLEGNYEDPSWNTNHNDIIGYDGSDLYKCKHRKVFKGNTEVWVDWEIDWSLSKVKITCDGSSIEIEKGVSSGLDWGMIHPKLFVVGYVSGTTITDLKYLHTDGYTLSFTSPGERGDVNIRNVTKHPVTHQWAYDLTDNGATPDWLNWA